MDHQVILKAGKDKPLRHRHPWVYSGAIGRVTGGEPFPGQIVRVVDSAGGFLAFGYYNSQSQIAVRVLDWHEQTSIDDAWWRHALASAIGRRQALRDDPDTICCRLIYAEADGLPGLIVDRYGDYLVIQSLTAGVDAVKHAIVSILNDLLHPAAIIERSDIPARELEGLPPAKGILSGSVPPPQIEVVENGLRFAVELLDGQKTGFYLDQRDNRRHVAAHASGRDVLDCFCYTGQFTVHALAAAAKTVTCVDSSEPALELLRRNVSLNSDKLSADSMDRITTVSGNAFELLRKFRDQARAFDMVILDPPKLAANRAQLDRALRAYKDINLLAMKLLRPDGILATFSCSGAVSVGAFQEMIAWAATDAERSVQILQRLSQPPDHPILVSFPESEYLKGLICRVV